MKQEIQNTFKALADPTRRQILTHLSTQDMTIAEVSSHFEMTRAAVKKHLTTLEKGKLISVKISGRERINKIDTQGLKAVNEWLSYFDQFWDCKLNNLHHAINKNSK